MVNNRNCTQCGCSSCKCGDRGMVKPNPVTIVVEQNTNSVPGPDGPPGDVYVPIETENLFTI